jgi:hypothetical protein
VGSRVPSLSGSAGASVASWVDIWADGAGHFPRHSGRATPRSDILSYLDRATLTDGFPRYPPFFRVETRQQPDDGWGQRGKMHRSSLSPPLLQKEKTAFGNETCPLDRNEDRWEKRSSFSPLSSALHKGTVSTGDGARAMSTIASPTKPQALGRVAPPTDGVTESRLQERAPPSNIGVGISGGGSPASRCVRYGFRRRHTIPLFPRCVGPSHFLIYDPPSPFPLLL